jgi:hypothetical protein
MVLEQPTPVTTPPSNAVTGEESLIDLDGEPAIQPGAGRNDGV